MAKELPYFKFEPNQWDNGKIQIANHETKGVFIDLCSMYWSRIGNVPYKLAVQKVCNGNAKPLDSLIEEDVIEVVDGLICIDFLNEQLNEFENISKQNSQNARDGWEKRRKNAKSKRPQSEVNAIREEKKREEERREEEIYREFSHLKLTIDEFDKLNETYSKQQIDDVLDSIQNYKKNKNYTSLAITARNWLKKEYGQFTTKTTGNDRMDRQREIQELADLTDEVLRADEPIDD